MDPVVETDEEGASSLSVVADRAGEGMESVISSKMDELTMTTSETAVEVPPSKTLLEAEGSLLEKLLKEEVTDLKMRTGLVSKLAEARGQSMVEKREVRKAAWLAETREEVRNRREFGRQNMAEVFPELVWKGIMEQLGRKDKVMMSRMSLVWRDVVKKERTTVLFPEVFNLLLETGSADEDPSGIMELRLVSKFWKKSVESSLETSIPQEYYYPLWEAFGMKSPSPDLDFPPLEPTFAGEIQQVTDFMERFRRPHPYSGRCPFFSGRLVLGGSEVEDGFWDAAERLLMEWGREVWHLQVDLSGEFSIVSVFDELCRLLRQVPNLRVLQISGLNVELHPRWSQFMTISSAWIRFYDELLGRMAQNPLPDLQYLNTLTVADLPPPIIDELLNKYGPTLENVSLCGIVADLAEYTGGANLQRLKLLEVVEIRPNPRSLAGHVFSGNWPSLEELRFSYGIGDGTELPALFKSVNGFGNTLRRLVLALSFCNCAKADVMKSLWLELPHVEVFFLSFEVGTKKSGVGVTMNFTLPKTMDFILPMGSLKELNLRYEIVGTGYENLHFDEERREAGRVPSSCKAPLKGGSSEDKSDGIIKFVGYMNRLYDSNIWTVMPELRKVRILFDHRRLGDDDLGPASPIGKTESKTFTREGYENHRRQ